MVDDDPRKLVALEAILARNPLPGVTGYDCTRLCQTKCTRNDYEESVAIRALKRVARDLEPEELRRRLDKGEVTLGPLDSCHLAPNEGRSIENRGNSVATMAVVVSK